jgi:hypothetical protein
MNLFNERLPMIQLEFHQKRRSLPVTYNLKLEGGQHLRLRSCDNVHAPRALNIKKKISKRNVYTAYSTSVSLNILKDNCFTWNNMLDFWF